MGASFMPSILRTVQFFFLAYRSSTYSIFMHLIYLALNNVAWLPVNEECLHAMGGTPMFKDRSIVRILQKKSQIPKT